MSECANGRGKGEQKRRERERERGRENAAGPWNLWAVTSPKSLSALPLVVNI